MRIKPDYRSKVMSFYNYVFEPSPMLRRYQKYYNNDWASQELPTTQQKESRYGVPSTESQWKTHRQTEDPRKLAIEKAITHA